MTLMNETTLMTKIAALLRKAESTTPAEAEALTAKAQELASLASIDLAEARSFIPLHERKEKPVQEVIRIGEAGKRGLSTFTNLFLNIGRANDLKFNIFSDSTAVIAFGFPSDIEVTKALYSSLVVQMVDASTAYLKTGAHRQETVWSHREWKQKPLDGRTARIAFQEAFGDRIGQRLAEVRREAISQARKVRAEARGVLVPAEVIEASDSVALVLASKKDEVGALHDAYNVNNRRRYRGTRASSSARGVSSAGRKAADSARLGGARKLSA